MSDVWWSAKLIDSGSSCNDYGEGSHEVPGSRRADRKSNSARPWAQGHARPAPCRDVGCEADRAPSAGQPQQSPVSPRLHVPAKPGRGRSLGITKCDTFQAKPGRFAPVCLHAGGGCHALQRAPQRAGGAGEHRNHADVRTPAPDARLQRRRNIGSGSMSAKEGSRKTPQRCRLKEDAAKKLCHSAMTG